MILKKYTNELLKVLIEEGKDVNLFELKRLNEGASNEIANIVFKGTPMSFAIRLADVDTRDVFRISFTQFHAGFPHFDDYYPYPLDETKSIFKNWLNEDVNKYIENENEVDYWKIAKENPLTIESIDFTKNEPFSIDDQKQMVIGLEEIKLLLSQNFSLTNQQIEITNNKIEYLAEATKRLNKTDWKGIAISTIVTIAYDLAFDETKRTMLFGLFSKLWAVIQQLPSPKII